MRGGADVLRRFWCQTCTATIATGTGRDKKSFWREVGSAWPHKNDRGFDLLIHEQLAVSGRTDVTERKDRAVTEQVD